MKKSKAEKKQELRQYIYVVKHDLSGVVKNNYCGFTNKEWHDKIEHICHKIIKEIENI